MCIRDRWMWIHGFLHRCTFSSHLLDWILKAMRKQTEIDKTNLIKIGSLPPCETLEEFSKQSTPPNWFLEQSTRCFEIDTWSHKQPQRCSEFDTRSPPNSNWCLQNQHTIPRRTWDALIPICCARVPFTTTLWGIHRTETDAAGDVPNTIRTENNRKKQSTQYLTRFGNLPTSSGQGRERFYWFNNQYKLI